MSAVTLALIKLLYSKVNIQWQEKFLKVNNPIYHTLLIKDLMSNELVGLYYKPEPFAKLL